MDPDLPPDPATPDPDSQHERAVGELLLAAAALDGDERSLYLQQLSDDRPELVAEARRRLLQAASLPPGFLATPADEVLAALLESRTPRSASSKASVPAEPKERGEEETRFELGEELGRGGMATVYKAYDRQLERPVALKFLDRGNQSTRDLLLHEARSQARVRHPSILEVYDTGEMEGRSYIAMRWVEGPTLLELPSSTSVETRLRLVLAAAEALHAAHREGLVHRDVKPSNILVERRAEGWHAWVADFGIALRQSNHDGLARPWSAAGTPAYMAPEALGVSPQVLEAGAAESGASVGGASRSSAGSVPGTQQGDPAATNSTAPVVAPDRRVDVYGLGVTLYQVLSGHRPFASSDLGELLTQIREQEPTPLSHHLPTVPRALEAVVMRCLAKDPAQRYASARDLAEDLRRYLDGDEVEAYSSSLVERAGRFWIRYRRWVIAGCTAAGLLLIASLMAAYQGLRAQEANQLAQQRRGQAEGLIGYMLTDLRGKLATLGRLELLDDVAQRAQSYFSAVPESELSTAELASRAQALYQLGEVHLERGDADGALAPLRRSLALARSLVEREPANLDHRFALGQSEFWVGKTHWDRGDLQAARPHMQRYLRISEHLLSERPEHPPFLQELAYAHSNLGSLAQAEGSHQAARDRFQSTLRLQQQLLQAAGEDPNLRFEIAATHNLLASAEGRLGHNDAKTRHLQAELLLRRQLLDDHPQNRHFQAFLGTSLDYLGEDHLHRGQWRAAEDHLQQAEAVFHELSELDPQNGIRRLQLAAALNKLGWLYWLDERLGLATAAWAQTEQLAEALVQEQPEHDRFRYLRAMAAYRQALLRSRAGGEAAAIEELEVARHWLRNGYTWLADSEHLRARLLLLHGQIAARQERAGVARQLWEEGLQIIDRLFSQAAPVVETRALTLLHLGRHERAQPLLAELHARGYVSPDLKDLMQDRGLPLPEPATTRQITQRRNTLAGESGEDGATVVVAKIHVHCTSRGVSLIPSSVDGDIDLTVQPRSIKINHVRRAGEQELSTDFYLEDPYIFVAVAVWKDDWPNRMHELSNHPHTPIDLAPGMRLQAMGPKLGWIEVDDLDPQAGGRSIYRMDFQLADGTVVRLDPRIYNLGSLGPPIDQGLPYARLEARVVVAKGKAKLVPHRHEETPDNPIGYEVQEDGAIRIDALGDKVESVHIRWQIDEEASAAGARFFDIGMVNATYARHPGDTMAGGDFVLENEAGNQLLRVLNQRTGMGGRYRFGLLVQDTRSNESELLYLDDAEYDNGPG